MTERNRSGNNNNNYKMATRLYSKIKIYHDHADPYLGEVREEINELGRKNPGFTRRLLDSGESFFKYKVRYPTAHPMLDTQAWITVRVAMWCANLGATEGERLMREENPLTTEEIYNILTRAPCDRYWHALFLAAYTMSHRLIDNDDSRIEAIEDAADERRRVFGELPRAALPLSQARADYEDEYYREDEEQAMLLGALLLSGAGKANKEQTV